MLYLAKTSYRIIIILKGELSYKWGAFENINFPNVMILSVFKEGLNLSDIFILN
jgi:hypothetical protein